MPDATYDAIIIGGGNKGLVTAMYLAKYGGMDVAVFEKRHEAGGGWCTDEGAAPGFLADYHASAVGAFYTLPLERDFPEWNELIQGFIELTGGASGAVFQEDDNCVVIYGRLADPNFERTAKEFGRFSEKDSESWMLLQTKLRKVAIQVLLEWAYNPPPPPGMPDALDKALADPSLGLDPSWGVKSVHGMLRDFFESKELVAMFMRYLQSYGILPNWEGLGMLGFLFLAVTLAPRTAGLMGGTHQWAHAATKIIAANGGHVLSKQAVDKVLIENGQAVGIRLSDGTEVKARKLVVSTLSPEQLCFQLIGKEHLDSRTLRRIQDLERRFTCITWYTWALHELPKWNAASINPDINATSTWTLISNDPTTIEREEAMIRLGRIPENLQLTIMAHSLCDPTRAPEGKYSVLTEQFTLPANAMTERQWLEFKKSHAEAVINLWQKHAPNMNWDNVIGYIPLTPYDHCRLDNMAPTGNWGVIDIIPSQFSKFRPIPELAGHRTPVKNLYATGAAWHPMSGGTSFQGYNCYKIIADDFGLRKPWEEHGHPW